ncbi:MAG TPA: hypothetical protein VK763_09065 [Terriglobales bacterium]|nr:hypothetical protein [Terriglobales bacterium]
MKKTLIGLAVLMAAMVTLAACGGSSNSSSSKHLSGLKFRAFVSNSLSGGAPVINIVDATRDVLSPSSISLFGTVPQAGLMAVSPDLRLTLVFSPPGDIAVIDNTTESPASGVQIVSLPGLTESIAIANTSATAYAAVPDAPVAGQAPGAVVVINLTNGTLQATIPVPAAHYLVLSPDGSSLLVFSDNSNNVTVIATGLIGTTNDPRQPVGGICCFDRPVWGVFADSATAYIFNCGAECPGGVAAGITTFDVGSPAPGPTVALSGATYGILNGGVLYVAGTPPHTACSAGAAGAPSCGTLNLVAVSSMKVMNSSPITITDGYHNRMAMGSNGQLFIGAKSCTSIGVIGDEIRGCLSIYNTSNSAVVIPPQIGDATGIEPIAGRNIVYVCEGGVFQVFDTTTDKLLVQVNPPTIDIVGFSIDVKVVDPPPSTCTMDCSP